MFLSNACVLCENCAHCALRLFWAPQDSRYAEIFLSTDASISDQGPPAAPPCWAVPPPKAGMLTFRGLDGRRDGTRNPQGDPLGTFRTRAPQALPAQALQCLVALCGPALVCMAKVGAGTGFQIFVVAAPAHIRKQNNKQMTHTHICDNIVKLFHVSFIFQLCV